MATLSSSGNLINGLSDYQRIYHQSQAAIAVSMFYLNPSRPLRQGEPSKADAAESISFNTMMRDGAQKEIERLQAGNRPPKPTPRKQPKKKRISKPKGRR